MIDMEAPTNVETTSTTKSIDELKAEVAQNNNNNQNNPIEKDEKMENGEKAENGEPVIKDEVVQENGHVAENGEVVKEEVITQNGTSETDHSIKKETDSPTEEKQPSNSNSTQFTPNGTLPKLEPLKKDSTTKLDLEQIFKSDKFQQITSDLKLKRKLAEKLTQELAAEEAKYTVLKKVRLSQLSQESKQQNEEKLRREREKQEKIRQMENERSSSNNTPTSNYNPTKRQRAMGAKRGRNGDSSSGKNTPTHLSETRFKPINPATATIGKNSNTKVLYPTPINNKNMTDSPNPMNSGNLTPSSDKDISIVGGNSRQKGRPPKAYQQLREMDDIRHLAVYLASNQNLNENDKTKAKKIVFRRKLEKLTEVEMQNKFDKDIIFFPNINANEFVNLIGLEQVVNNIKIQNNKKKGKDVNDTQIHGHLENAEDWRIKVEDYDGLPFECEICGTDFTPQWYKALEEVEKEKKKEEEGDKKEEKREEEKDKNPKKEEETEPKTDSMEDDDNDDPIKSEEEPSPKKPNCKKNPLVYCQKCFYENQQKYRCASYKYQLDKVLLKAKQAEQEMEEELEEEYNRQVEIIREQEAAKRELANRQILEIQRKQEALAAKRKAEREAAEKLKAQQIAKAQEEQLKRSLAAKQREKEAQQAAMANNQNNIQNLLSNLLANGGGNNANNIRIIQQLMTQNGGNPTSEQLKLIQQLIMRSQNQNNQNKQQTENHQQSNSNNNQNNNNQNNNTNNTNRTNSQTHRNMIKTLAEKHESFAIIEKLIAQIEKTDLLNNATDEEINKIIVLISEQISSHNSMTPEIKGMTLNLLRTYLDTRAMELKSEKENNDRAKKQQQALQEQQARLIAERKAAEKRKRQQEAAEQKRRELQAEQERQARERAAQQAAQQLAGSSNGNTNSNNSNNNSNETITKIIALIAASNNEGQKKELLKALMTVAQENKGMSEKIMTQVLTMLSGNGMK